MGPPPVKMDLKRGQVQLSQKTNIMRGPFLREEVLGIRPKYLSDLRDIQKDVMSASLSAMSFIVIHSWKTTESPNASRIPGYMF